MNVRRLPIILCLALLLNCLLLAPAQAGIADFFGFAGSDKGKSGLDFNRGYDVNTVTTVSGRVTAAPRTDAGQVIIEVKSGADTVSVSVGPKSFWDKKGIAVRVNDEVTVKGSKAQGEDGKQYLLSQKLVNRTTGGQLELRSEKGEPSWSGRSGSGTGMDHSTGGGMFQNGMMRGGGMMRH